MATQFELARIARAEDFQERVGYCMVKEAIARLAATPQSPDILLGQRILKAQENILQWCLGAVADPSISAGAHALDGSTIIDSTLATAITALWAPFSV